MSRPETMRARALAALPLLLLIGVLFSIAVATSPVRTAPIDLLLALGSYALLGMLLQRVSDAGRAVHPALGILAALAVGAVLAWHVREQTRVPDGPVGLALLALALGLGYALLNLALRPAPQRAIRPLAAALILVVAFPAYVIAAYQRSPVFRWYLLRHHKLLGTPAYFALEPGVDALEQRIWERHQQAEVPPHPGEMPEPPSADAPAVLFVLVDTLRADALAAYGGDPAWMPELNAFAEEALVFDDVLANASWTRPSVASYFTGLLQEHHGAVDRGDRLPESAVTLAERYRESGYRTAAFVANYAAVGRDAGFAQGFDVFVELASERWPYARADEVTAAAAAWLREHGEGPPWFLYVHYLDPHIPYLSGGDDTTRHGPARRAYENELRYADPHVASLLRTAEHIDRPVVTFLTSDHGEEFGEHGERGHGRSLYREVVHLPALLRASWLEPGRIDARLEQRDFFDLLERVRVEGSGLSPRRFAHDRDRERRYSSVYTTTDSAFYRPYLERVVMRSLEADGLSYIWSAYGRTEELYDREGDPAQKLNLARLRDEELARLRAEVEEHVRDWTRRTPIAASQKTVEMLKALGYVQ